MKPSSLFRAVAVKAIKAYQKYLSPMKGRPTCRFYPTCSAYAIKAYETCGLLGGTALTVWRILRCNPFSRGGYDPFPPGFEGPKYRQRKDFMIGRHPSFFIPENEKSKTKKG